MNYIAWSAAHFNEHEFLSTVLFQSAVLDFKIDIQTYLKCQLSLYSEDIQNVQREFKNLDENLFKKEEIQG